MLPGLILYGFYYANLIGIMANFHISVKIND